MPKAVLCNAQTMESENVENLGPRATSHKAFMKGAVISSHQDLPYNVAVTIKCDGGEPCCAAAWSSSPVEYPPVLQQCGMYGLNNQKEK